jgi:hypothetical protein
MNSDPFGKEDNYLVLLMPAVYVITRAGPQALDPDLIMPYDEAWELAANHGARDGVPVWDTEDPKSVKPQVRYCGPEEIKEYYTGGKLGEKK